MSERIASMAYIVEHGHDLLVKCSAERNKVNPCPVFRLEPDQIRRRFLPDERLCDLEARYKCPKCGAPVLTDIVISMSPKKVAEKYGY